MEKERDIREGILEDAIRSFCNTYSHIRQGEYTEEQDFTTDFVREALSGVADFNRDEIAEALYRAEYDMTYDEDTGEVAWRCYVKEGGG